jgi:hypothetical protein
MAVWCNGRLVYFTVLWYIFSRFGMSVPEKSGNPGHFHGSVLSRKGSILSPAQNITLCANLSKDPK